MVKGKRVRKNGKFVVPTVQEMRNDRKAYLDSEKREVLAKMFDLQFEMINFRMHKARIDFRQSQLDADVIVEEFNGAKKSIEILKSEMDLDIYAYNRLIMEMDYMGKYLKEKGFTDDQVRDIRVGKFDINKWADENIGKEEKPDMTHIG